MLRTQGLFFTQAETTAAKIMYRYLIAVSFPPVNFRPKQKGGGAKYHSKY